MKRNADFTAFATVRRAAAEQARSLRAARLAQRDPPAMAVQAARKRLG